MIYLIDDKINRQTALGWNNIRFSTYSSKLVTISAYKDIETNRAKIFQEENQILFHESFFDYINHDIKESNDIRTDLRRYAKVNKNFKIVFFSGSIKTRHKNRNIAYMPVHVLYTNLEWYLEQPNQNDLESLIFGSKANIEKKYLEKQIDLNNKNEVFKIEPEGSIFIARAMENEIVNPFTISDDNSFYLDTASDERMNDAYYDKLIQSWFSGSRYDKIFIPLCFGETLSDFNGLRLTFHIRTTSTINQGCPIYLYSYVDSIDLIENKCFDILKLKNTFLIDYSHQAFQKANNVKTAHTPIGRLKKQMKKVNLQLPDNTLSNHSITNEWAMYKWTLALDSDVDVLKAIKHVKSDLYFKYMLTLNDQKQEIDDTITFEKIESPTKVLLIDDEADKGWLNIMCELLCDRSGVKDIYFLGDELKNLHQDLITDQVIYEIKEHDINLLILDFRIIENDFKSNNIVEAITGYKILKRVKEYNPGIQIMMFSATNKISNLTKLQDVGLDSFILKAPDTMEQFYDSFLKLSKKTFLVNIFEKYENIAYNLRITDYADGTSFEDFIKSCLDNVKAIKISTSNINLSQPITLDIIFMHWYNFLERFSNYYLYEENHRFYMGVEDVIIERYDNRKNKFRSLGEFEPKSKYEKPSFFQAISGLLVKYFQVKENRVKRMSSIKNLSKIRNDYTHRNKQFFTIEELRSIIDLCTLFTANIKE